MALWAFLNNTIYESLIDIHIDNISFNETLPMFNNAGNNTFDFDAKYGRDFNVKNGQQTEKELDNGWEFTSKYSVVSMYTCVRLALLTLTAPQVQGQTQRHTIAGLSVFTAKDPKQASFDFCVYHLLTLLKRQTNKITFSSIWLLS